MSNARNTIAPGSIAQPQDGTADLVIAGLLVAATGVVIIAVIRTISREIARSISQART